MSRSDFIDVRISRKVLWIGSEAYPVQNISRAKTIGLIPDRNAAWNRFMTVVVFSVILGTAAAVAMKLAPRLSTVQKSDALRVAAVGMLLLALGLFIISIIRLRRVLLAPTYYALAIDSSGITYKTLVSLDGNQLKELARQIMKAIDDPQIEFRELISNCHFGDQIYQYGDFNVGKAVK
jgi:hypothetical protein